VTTKAKVKLKIVGPLGKPTQPKRTLAYTGLDQGLTWLAVVILAAAGLILALRRRHQRSH
jgi:LPXTG-motif cell wall-anchored protein